MEDAAGIGVQQNPPPLPLAFIVENIQKTGRDDRANPFLPTIGLQQLLILCHSSVICFFLTHNIT